MFTSARSMLESSSELTFKCLNLGETSQRDMMDELFERAKFDKTKNNWRCIDDFDWLSSNVPSKNFKVIN